MLTIPRREEIEAAVPELMDRAVYLFSVDEKPYFLVSVPEKEAEEILAKLKEGAEKEPEQLYYAGKTPDRHPCDGADAPGICSDHGGAAVALETEPSVLRALWGKDGGQQDRAGRSSARSAVRRNIQRSPRQSSWRSRTGTNFLCRATASTTVLTVDMR